jgi:hypothetical protein
MICPEFRDLWKGIEMADSLVFNPHKWLGAQFDCSAHFLRDAESLVRTLAIHPEFLKTHGLDGVINYSEWSVPLGRRFRALKIWFLLRAYGLEGLRNMIRNHVRWSQKLASRLAATSDFRVTTGAVLSLFSFRHEPKNIADLDNYNLRLINAINDDGRIYLTQERVDGQFVIRFQAGSFEITEADAYEAFDVIVEIAQRLSAEAGVPDHKPNVRDKAKRPGSRPSQPATRPDAEGTSSFLHRAAIAPIAFGHIWQAPTRRDPRTSACTISHWISLQVSTALIASSEVGASTTHRPALSTACAIPVSSCNSEMASRTLPVALQAVSG